MLGDLLNQLTNLTEPLILIIDDYHLIEAQEIHDGLAFLLDHAPPSFHLALITRADPPLGLARLQARGLLTKIRAAELRFATEEASRFLRDIMGPGSLCRRDAVDRAHHNGPAVPTCRLAGKHLSLGL